MRWGDGETSATQALLPISRNKDLDLDLGRWPKVAPLRNVIQGVAELNQVYSGSWPDIIIIIIIIKLILSNGKPSRKGSEQTCWPSGN